MRRRIMALAATAALLAVVLLAIPLGVLIERNYLHDERLELQQAAASVAARARGDSPVRVPNHVEGREIAVSVYDHAGRRLAGNGPLDAPAAARAALTGHETSTTDARQIAVGAPVSDGDRVVAAVYATTGLDAVRSRTHTAWLVLGAMCFGAVGLSAVGSAMVTRRLTAPIERLRTVAQRIGTGDLAVQADRSGVAELDALAVALNESVGKIRTMMERERALSTEMSHQLRTPLNGLALQLEAARSAVGFAPDPHRTNAATARLDAAMVSVERLERTVAEVIALARELPTSESVPVGDLVDALDTRWHGLLAAGSRPLQITVDPAVPALLRLSPAASRQILDVLVDNAWRHGRGAVTVRITPRDDDTVAVEVSDEGALAGEAWQLFDPRGADPRDGGIGLPYARRLAEAEGARLMLVAHSPPTFALLIETTAADFG